MAPDLAGFRSHAACEHPGESGTAGMRRNVLQDESSRRPHLSDARRKARFSTVLTTRFEWFPALSIARNFFPGTGATT
jgi:hypothetical protein